MNFWHLVRVIRAKWLLIAGVVVVTLLVVAIAAPKPKMLYTASATMSPTPQVMMGGLSTTVGKDGQSQYVARDRNVILSNLIVLAKGGEVYQRALDFLALPVDQQKTLAVELFGRDLPRYKQITRVQPTPGEMITFAKWDEVLEVSPIVNASIGEKGTTTDIIRISIRMPNGDDTIYLANAVAYAFTQIYQEKSQEESRKYAGFLGTNETDARARLQSLQKQIADYKASHNVVSVDSETQDAVASLAGLQSQYDSARSAVSEAEAAVRDIDMQLATQPLVTKQKLPADMNPNVEKLKDELSQAEAELRMLAQRYKPAHETYKLAQTRIEVLKQRIAREGASYAPPVLNEVHQNLVKMRSQYQFNLATARAKLAAVSGSLAEAKGRASGLAKSEPVLAELMRDYAMAEENYRRFSTKKSEAIIGEKEFAKTGSIVPYGLAAEAQGPIAEGVSRRVLLVYGFFLSLILGIAFSVWLDSIDNRMRNAADVEELMGLPVIGLTPRLTGTNTALPKLTHIYPLSAMAESYKILRTNLLFELRDNPFRTLMVATGRPGQGATTTICNLAIALAQSGKRIILIDADMRRPSLHKFFGVPNDNGLSTLLQGTALVADAFQKTDIKNLLVLPAGPQPLNPSELLGSERMREIVAKLQDHCDLVLFDSPSAIVFSDGPMLASWIDAVVMVVSANQVPRGTEVKCRELLKKAHANIIGVVVNNMAPENVDSCFYYSHYYSDSVPKAGHVEALDTGHDEEDDVEKPQPKTGRGAVLAPVQAESFPAATGNNEEDNPFPD